MIEPKKTEITHQIDQEKNISGKKLFNFKPKKGQKVWEYNVVTGQTIPATFEPIIETLKHDDLLTGERHASKRIIQKIDCLYVVALNKKNALKKFRKCGF